MWTLLSACTLYCIEYFIGFSKVLPHWGTHCSEDSPVKGWKHSTISTHLLTPRNFQLNIIIPHFLSLFPPITLPHSPCNSPFTLSTPQTAPGYHSVTPPHLLRPSPPLPCPSLCLSPTHPLHPPVIHLLTLSPPTLTPLLTLLTLPPPSLTYSPSPLPPPPPHSPTHPPHSPCHSPTHPPPPLSLTYSPSPSPSLTYSPSSLPPSLTYSPSPLPPSHSLLLTLPTPPSLTYSPSPLPPSLPYSPSPLPPCRWLLSKRITQSVSIISSTIMMFVIGFWTWGMSAHGIKFRRVTFGVFCWDMCIPKAGSIAQQEIT